MFGAGSVVAALTGELDYAGLGMVAITFGLAVALAIYAFGNTSGAHINPAGTVSLAAVGRFPWADVPAHIGAQLGGGLVGAALIVAAFGGDAVDPGIEGRGDQPLEQAAVTTPGPGGGRPSQRP